jgi:uncharacterized membrane protein YphA (DoxX/SURF4 family)
MNWYYAKNGHQNGPVPTEDMIDRVAMGEISPTDLAWCEGMADWLPVSEIPQLKVLPPVRDEPVAASTAGAAQPAPYQAPAPVAQAATPSYAAPGQPPSQGLAIASLVCGILGLIGCCMWFISLPAALAAIVTGHLANSKIKADPQRFTGKGMARTGLITGYLGAICSIIAAFFWFQFKGLTEEQAQEKVIQWFPEAQQQEMREQLQKQNESR